MTRPWPGRICRNPIRQGFTLIELLVGVGLIAVLLMIAIPMTQTALLRARYTRAGANARVVVAQAIAFSVTNGSFPHGIAELRNTGFVSIPDRDPWNTDYQLCTILETGAPGETQADIWVCSVGPVRVGNCPDPAQSAIEIPGFPSTGMNGSVGFSSVYGPWTGN